MVLSNPMKWGLLGAWAACLLSGCATAPESPSLSVRENDRAIVVYRGAQPALVYQKVEMPAPRGERDDYARSGFIHPLYAPSGGLLTRIHPMGHYHHMGLWHAWVQTTHEGGERDFWNLAKGQAGVRYRETLSLSEADNTAGFGVRQEHFAKEGEGTRTILEDIFNVEVKASGEAYWLDYQTVQENVSEAPITFEAYRYGGGIAYRGPEHWDGDNSDYLTSEGFGRTDGHGTRARWVRMSGPTETGMASVTILSHPDNVNSPQPVRIWPEGPMFFNYVPAQKAPLVLAPGERITLRYRVLVTDDVASPDIIEAAWRDYVQP